MENRRARREVEEILGPAIVEVASRRLSAKVREQH